MGRCVALWLDDARIGCGERQFLVLRDGRKWVRLLAIATMTTVRMPSGEFHRRRKRELALPRRRLRRRLRANAAV